MNFIEALKHSGSLMEIRPASRKDDYLEAVIRSEHAGCIEVLLTQHLGEAHKVPGQTVLFDDDMRQVIDAAGGIMIDQTLYYKKEGNSVLYAMLWPWQSDRTRITLKAGIIADQK